MALKYLILAAAPILGGIACMNYLQLSRPDDVTTEARVAAVNASPATQNAVGMVETTALREDIASLRAEVAALRQRAARQNQPMAMGTDTQSVPDSHDPNVRAEAARKREAEMELVDATFRRQAVDPSWAASTASDIREALSGVQGGSIQAQNIDCRSGSCRVELPDDGSGRLSASLPLVALQLAAQTPNIVANTIPHGNGTSTLVLYMSRSEAQ